MTKSADETEQPYDPDAPEEVSSLGLPSHEELLKQLNEAEEKANEYLDVARRAKAELENYKRLAQKDIEHAHKYSSERYIRDVLEVFDNIDYSITAAHAENANLQSIQKGLELTGKMLENMLQKLSLKQIDPLGEPFNPTLHEAMSMEKNTDYPANTVIRVLQKGYQLHDRVIRPARVAVSKHED
jgi:molecular chaperone GrpE